LSDKKGVSRYLHSLRAIAEENRFHFTNKSASTKSKLSSNLVIPSEACAFQATGTNLACRYALQLTDSYDAVTPVPHILVIAP